MTVDPTTRAETDIALSVVIITENEADRIAECIESVFAACRDLPAFEVILVDSASTDRTVECATGYPITVLRIPEEHTVSCGAGRYVGDQVAGGELVLHVDGDMVLTETWLPRAIDYLRNHDVAAAEGCLDRSTQSGIQEVSKVGGVMLYDAAALRSVGGFDPFLPGYEDVDVGYQLTAAGHRLVRLPEVSARHHDDDGALRGPLRRWRQGYYIAPGQTIRKQLRSPPVLRRLLARQQYKLALVAWLCLGVASLSRRSLSVGWLALSLLGFAAIVSRRGAGGAVEFLLAKGAGTAGVVVGLGRQTPPAEAFPVAAVEVVTEGRILEGGVEP